MANTPNINVKGLEQDIIAYHKKRGKVYKTLLKEYPRNYQEIAEKYVNPVTGKPITRQYIVEVKRRLLKEGKIKPIKSTIREF